MILNGDCGGGYKRDVGSLPTNERFLRGRRLPLQKHPAVNFVTRTGEDTISESETSNR